MIFRVVFISLIRIQILPFSFLYEFIQSVGECLGLGAEPVLGQGEQDTRPGHQVEGASKWKNF
jgi:hypothetical protein